MLSTYRNDFISTLLIIAVSFILPLSAFGRDFTVVIDPGHGGKDVGADGKKCLEKDVVLRVSKALGEMLMADKFNVVFTRSSDVFVDLQKRASIANEVKADVFVSIHCNSMGDETAGRERYKGAVTYVMGLNATGQNLEVVQHENSVVAIDGNYSIHSRVYDSSSDESHIIYEIKQRQHMDQSINLAQEIQHQMVEVAGREDGGIYQAGFIVLSHVSMPAVLVELDYLSNPDSEAFLSSDDGVKKLASALYVALKRYREIVL